MKKWTKTLIAIPLLLPSEILAHKLYHQRSFDLFIGEDKIELYVIYRVPPGEKAYKIRKKADLNLNNFIDDDEIEIVKNELIVEALSGFRVTLQGYPVNIRISDVKLDLARESYSSLEISAFITVPIWLAPAPPPPSFKIGIIEEKFEHSHIRIKSQFKIKTEKGKIKLKDGLFHGELRRFSPIIIRVQR